MIAVVLVTVLSCESNMTQSELAAKSGVRQSNINRIENGSALPKLDTLAALAMFEQ